MDLEIHRDGRWVPCASLEAATADQTVQGPVRVQHDPAYVLENLEARDYRALSVRVPVNFATPTFPRWPSILLDLLPQGAARRRLQRGIEQTLTPWELLARGAVNPVGNLRIRPESGRIHPPHPGFTLEDMVRRGDAFVDHAAGVGATVAGATDTQGEAPKFWVVQDLEGRWHPDGGNLPFPVRRHALLKFPVPEAGPRAADILRHEALYQQVASRCGLRVTPDLPEYLDGALLLPRFDRRCEAGHEVRLGVESMYSICGVVDPARPPLRHDHVLIELAHCASDFPAEFVEYVCRDLLGLAMGNRDNHGRNTALLKDVDGTNTLAPLYDFGPAFLDARAIARVIRWEGEAPVAGAWPRVLDNLDTRFGEAGLDPPRALFEQAVRQFLPQLENLPTIMLACGVDEQIVDGRRADIAQLVAGLSEPGVRP